MNLKRLEELAKPRSEAAIKAAERRKQHREYHNTDIAACGHATCPSRESCLRWVLGQRMEDYQCFGEFTPKDGKCKFYRWTSERADDSAISNFANTGKDFKDNYKQDGRRNTKEN